MAFHLVHVYYYNCMCIINKTVYTRHTGIYAICVVHVKY